MRNLFACVALASLLLVSFGCGNKDAENGDSGQPKQPTHHSPISKEAPPAEGLEALKPMLVKGSPTVVFLYAKWCPVCRKFKPVVQELSAKSKFEHIKVKYVDADEERDLSKSLEIESIPVMLLFQKDGSYVEKITGSIEEDKLEKELLKLQK